MGGLEQRATQQRSSGAFPRRILLAEDDPELRKLLTLVLRRDGHHVTEVSDGRELLEVIGAQLAAGGSHPRQIDLVITDLQMPGYTGLQALAGIRALPRRVPVILITAHGSDVVHRDAYAGGVAAVFDKPFELDELRAALVNLPPPPAVGSPL